jgi:hypothetical protein
LPVFQGDQADLAGLGRSGAMEYGGDVAVSHRAHPRRPRKEAISGLISANASSST